MTSLTRAVNSLLAAVSPCCGAAAAANSTETEKIEEVEEHDHTFRGAPQDGFGPELWGITLEQLEAINDSVPRHYTMRDVVEHFVKPKTKGTGTGYAPKLFLTLS